MKKPKSSPAKATLPAIKPQAQVLHSLRDMYLSTLSRPLNPVELAVKLRRLPTVTEQHRQQCAEERLVTGEELQRQVVVPHPAAIGLYYSMRTALHIRYTAVTADDSRILQQFHGLEAGTIPGRIDNSLIRPSASIGLLGPTGSGKSTLLETIADLMPGCVRRSDVIPGAEVVQVPIIYVALTGDSTIKNLLLRIIEAIDRRVGTDANTSRILRSKPSAETLKIYVQQCCVRYGVGIIFVDEMQALTSSRADGAALVINELLYIRDALGIPMVFSGTYRMMSLLTCDARLTRRVSQNGLFPMSYSTSPNDVYWTQLCDARWKALIVRNPTPMTKSMRALLFKCTQGMTWALPSLLIKAQQEAILSAECDEDEIIDEQLIIDTFATRCTEIHKMVQALKSRDATLLETEPDLYHRDFDAHETQKRTAEFQLLKELDIGGDDPALLEATSTEPAKSAKSAKSATVHRPARRRKTVSPAMKKAS